MLAFLPVLFSSFINPPSYYKNWSKVIPAILTIAIIFIVWDVIFTKYYYWGFNPLYYGGLKILGLPIEEILWFFIIPFASIFVYENCRHYFRNIKFLKKESIYIEYFILAFCLITAIINYDKVYTFSSFAFCAFCIIYNLSIWQKNLNIFFLAYLFTLIPMLFYNSLLTGCFTNEPLVVYNEKAIIGTRLLTMPIEDLSYQFVLLFLNIKVLTSLRSK